MNLSERALARPHDPLVSLHFVPSKQALGKTDLDWACMARLAQGDKRALDELMSRWQRPVFGFLLRLVGNQEDALDLAQETFVRLYRARQTYRPSAPFSTYLFSIAANLARNFLRWKRRHKSYVCPGKEPNMGSSSVEEIIDETPSPREQLHHNEREKAIRDAVLALPPAMRVVLVLFEYEDLSYQQIAQILGMSTKAVECRLYRARHILKRKLRTFLEEKEGS